MKYFQESEFQGWFDKMDPFLLFGIDYFREYWGAPVSVSPVDGAVGRHLGTHNRSGHNIDVWGKVMAIDLFPQGMKTGQDFKRAFDCAVKAGLLGFGVYPDWKPSPGVHLDMVPRAGRGVGNPGRWSAFKIDGKQTYFPIDKAFNL